MISLQKLIVLTLSSIIVIQAHTWIGCTDYRADGTCGGFIRNYHGRDTPGSDSTDDFYTNKLLGQNPEFQVCKSDTQATPAYSTQYPRATARAGSTLKTMYTPNGHSDPGDVGETTFARIHWNRGVNGPSGTLRFRRDLNATNELSRTNYAVNCKKTGNVASLPCVNPYTIPADTPPGVYQFVWYWPYNKVATQKPFGEEYYSCFEVNVVAANAALPSTAAVPSSASRSSASSSSAISSSARTSRSSSAARTSATRLQETSEEENTQQTSQNVQTSDTASSTNSNPAQLDVAANSNKLVAFGLLSFALLI